MLGERYRLESLRAPRIVPELGLHQTNPQHYAYYMARGINEPAARALAKEQTQINQGLTPRATQAADLPPVNQRSDAAASAGHKEGHVPPVQRQVRDGDACLRRNPQHPAYYMAQGTSYKEARAMAKAKTQANQGLAGNVPTDIGRNKNPQTIGYYIEAGYSYAEAKRMAKEATLANQSSLAAARARFQTKLKQLPTRPSYDHDLD